MSLIDLKDVKIIIDVPYSIALEYLMHAMTHTRPNIVFFINKVAKYKANLSQAHWFAIKCMMRLTFDYVFILANGVISLQNQKQTTIILSFTKEKYTACASATK
uniref:Uncharacterized protein n=2 Tax=Physcomitrium patens TaxID=3218 RepID=A0A7I4BU44_PHYPA